MVKHITNMQIIEYRLTVQCKTKQAALTCGPMTTLFSLNLNVYRCCKQML